MYNSIYAHRYGSVHIWNSKILGSHLPLYMHVSISMYIYKSCTYIEDGFFICVAYIYAYRHGSLHIQKSHICIDASGNMKVDFYLCVYTETAHTQKSSSICVHFYIIASTYIEVEFHKCTCISCNNYKNDTIY